MIMSTKAYSEDLRIRVINYIKSGNSQRGVSRLFSVSKSAVNRWWNRYKEEGSLSAKPKLGSKSKVSAQELETFVNQNPCKTLKEIGSHFGLKRSTIQKRLQNLGFRYKKKPSPMWKQTNKRDPYS
jgi:transposase